MPDSSPKVALCVGINYVDAAPAIPALRFAEPDAREMASLLQERGFQVTTLLGAAATRRAILQSLQALAQQPANLCILYFSGHGMHGTGVLDQDRAYFVPYDLDPADSGLGVALIDLAAALEARFRATSAFALFDCCYAGTIAAVAIDPTVAAQNWRQNLQLQSGGTGRAVAVPDGAAVPAATPGCRALIAACPANVEAREWADLQHGVMTYYALLGWQGKAADPSSGEITDGGLYGYISHELQRLQLPPLA
ncbi:MAG: caspase family protein, partial [Candidatus Dormibacteraeota bacterium]|nr:caspase family protein [Candidatus Dormibacteraeota bacterium]